MKITNKVQFGKRFFLWASALWLFFVFSGVFLTPQGWRRVTEYYMEFLLMEGLILAAAFLPKLWREAVFFAEYLLVIIQVGLFQLFIYARLGTEREDLYNIISMTAITVSVFLWYHIYWKRKHFPKIGVSLAITAAMPFVLDGWIDGFWKVFWISNYFLISSEILFLVSGISGMILCLCRNMLQYIITSLLIVGVILWCSFHLTYTVKTYIFYGTSSGNTEKVIPMELVDQQDKQVRLDDFPTPYKICMIWNTDKAHDFSYWYHQFEKLALLYRYEKLYSFIFLGADPENTEPHDLFAIHKTEHFHLPLLKIVRPKSLWTELRIHPTSELVCVFRNDTLIFLNDLENTERYLEKWNRK